MGSPGRLAQKSQLLGAPCHVQVPGSPGRLSLSWKVSQHHETGHDNYGETREGGEREQGGGDRVTAGVGERVPAGLVACVCGTGPWRTGQVPPRVWRKRGATCMCAYTAAIRCSGAFQSPRGEGRLPAAPPHCPLCLWDLELFCPVSPTPRPRGSPLSVHFRVQVAEPALCRWSRDDHTAIYGDCFYAAD